MPKLVWNRETLVWAILAGVTGLSWWLGTNAQAVDVSSDHTRTSVMLLVLAFIKVRLIIRYFMEVRHAPLVLRLICESWTILACGVVLALYFRPI